jgi:NhaA family Na+:H+ antiporter
MSLIIAGQALPLPDEFAAAKIAVFAASVLLAAVGVAVLRNAPPSGDVEQPAPGTVC